MVKLKYRELHLIDNEGKTVKILVKCKDNLNENSNIELMEKFFNKTYALYEMKVYTEEKEFFNSFDINLIEVNHVEYYKTLKFCYTDSFIKNTDNKVFVNLVLTKELVQFIDRYYYLGLLESIKEVKKMNYEVSVHRKNTSLEFISIEDTKKDIDIYSCLRNNSILSGFYEGIRLNLSNRTLTRAYKIFNKKYLVLTGDFKNVKNTEIKKYMEN